MIIGKLLDQVRADLQIDTERGKLVRSAILTSILKISSASIAFIASLVYARALGPHDYGLFAYVFAWSTLLTIPSGLGIPTYLVREGVKSPSGIGQLKRWADKRIVVAGIIGGVILSCAYFIPNAASGRILFIIAAPLPLITNLGYVRSALLQTQGWIARSQWPSLIAGPVLALLVLILFWSLFGRLNPIVVMLAMAMSATLVLMINEIQVHRSIPSARTGSAVTIRLTGALPFMWLGMLYIINSRIDLIMLGSLRGAHDAGIYSVSCRAAELIGFFMQSASIVITPRVVALYEAGDHSRLQRLLTAATRRVALITAPIATVFLLGANPILHYLYGAEYQPGTLALQILSLAQFAAITSGPKSVVLNMTGRERFTLMSMGFSVTLNIILNGLFIPLYGIEGTAFATGISIVAYNFVLWYLVRTHLALRTDIVSHG